MKAILILLLVISPALAQPVGSPEAKAKAREYFRTGTQHFDLSEFADALNDFKEAYRLYEEPTFLFNIGQCHRQLGQKDQAIRFFRVYLSKVPNAPNAREVRDMIGKLEVALEEERKSQSVRPQGTLSPPEPSPAPLLTAPSPAPVATTTPAPTTSTTTTTPKEVPVYKKWWLWTAVAVVVVAGVGIGLGVGLSSSGNSPTATTDLGTYKPF